MAKKLQIKRGTKAKLPALSSGEFGLCTDTSELYVGGSSGNIKVNKTLSELGGAESSHKHAARDIAAGTLAGGVVANASAVATLGTAQVRNIYFGTADMTAGTTELPAGDIYFVYEA